MLTLLSNDAANLALSGPEGIVHYVQWGKEGQALAEGAVASGRWTAGDVVPRPAEAQWLVYDGEGFRATDWQGARLDSPTLVQVTNWGETKAVWRRQPP